MKLRVLPLLFAALSLPGQAQVADYTPVTRQMLINPAPDDWLMFSRTYDAQRFSPLTQINRNNVGKLTLAWSRHLGTGNSETIPLVHDGVMYLAAPGAKVLAMDAGSGEVLWEYQREVSESVGNSARSKSLAIFSDVIVFTSPDSYIVGLDARTGKLRWETLVGGRGHTSAPLIVDGLAISGGACFGNRDNCFLAAHDALTGEERWRFYTTPEPGEPGDESWNGAELANRQASTWGLPGSWDPERNTIYWGIANAMPDHRAQRHGGNADGTGFSAPADLYSNSTVALDPATGELRWYYQHLPGDDWDLDATHERTLITTRLAPDPRFVKWTNPAITTGEERDVAVTIPEGGGIWVLDRDTGEFLWAMPFPYDDPNWWLDTIDPANGIVSIKRNLVYRTPGETKTICFWNTRSYWPTAYSPQQNALYTAWVDACRELTMSSDEGFGEWRVVPRPGADPTKLSGLARIDMSSGEVSHFDVGRVPGNGAMLVTAGDLVFHGDMNRRFRAFDAASGEQLWESIVDANVSVSTISYAVNGRQYVAVMTGETLKLTELLGLAPELDSPRGHNSLFVFALPE